MEKKRRNKRKIKQIQTCLTAMLLTMAVLLGIGAFYVNSRYVFHKGVDGIVFDKYESGTETIRDGEDTDAGVDVPDGSFRVHVNHLPSYDTTKGYQLQIWNPSNNKYLMRVRIEQNAATLYASDLIRIGHKKDYLELTNASDGTATAVFTAYDQTTLEMVGSTEVQITLPKVTQ